MKDSNCVVCDKKIRVVMIFESDIETEGLLFEGKPYCVDCYNQEAMKLFMPKRVRKYEKNCQTS